MGRAVRRRELGQSQLQFFGIGENLSGVVLLKMQAEGRSCSLVLHKGRKKVIKRSLCSCSKAFTHPQILSCSVPVGCACLWKEKEAYSLTKIDMHFSLIYQPYREIAMSKSAVIFSPGPGFVEIMWHPEMPQYGQVSLGFGTLLVNKVVFRTLTVQVLQWEHSLAWEWRWRFCGDCHKVAS